ncbi:helix-turn-helix transcriptional regulator [Acetobacterium sp.]|uniref:helix-turn-helix transcriptional regulator n=1 Tax=Acetobacterium sp. TaxID=1872094 RepID=UPI0027159107|nr:helix-turn-helix transcriptional regulator [Acetobacterium sp.]MDO9492479.1 helix-turn-helix transcriptional regulator [Acetobacterium sp.]
MGVGKNIKKILDNKGMRVSELAELTGVPYGTLHAMIKRDSDGINLKTLQNIAEALGLELSELTRVDYPFKDNNLAKYREEMGLTAEELAEKLDMNIDRYTMYETGELPMLTEYWDVIEVMYKEKTGKELETQYNRPSFEKPSREADLLHHFNKLNEPGQDKAVESVELLTKVPEYKK